MPTDTQTAEQKTPLQQQQQPQTSALWQNFTGAGAAAAGGVEQRAGTDNGNNNYVNFNQFIMQHNLFGGGSGASGTVSTAGINAAAMPFTPAARTDVASTFNGAAGDAAAGYFGYTAQPTATAQKTSNDFTNFQQTNFFNQNSNLFQYNNDVADIGGVTASSNNYAPMTNGHNNYNNMSTTNTNYNQFDIYTPFGNDGTTYFANPFATGFDFNASNLQATATEFVPRFNKLTLNDINKTTTATNGNAERAETSNTNVMHNIENFTLDTAMESTDLETRNAGNKTMPQFKNRTSNIDSSTSSPTASSLSSTGSGRNGNVLSGRNTGALSKTARNALRNDAVQQKRTQSSEKLEKSAAARAAERDSRRYQNGNNNSNYNNTPNSVGNHVTNGSSTVNCAPSGSRRSVDFNERDEQRYERAFERMAAHGNRGNNNNSNNNRVRDYHHRSNKRHDDWNRNRDRINGFRVDEKHAYESNGKDSPLHTSPEKKSSHNNSLNSPKKVYPENEKLSQREKLMRDIETRRLECLVCVEPIKAHQFVWSCNNCYHILHLQCIIKWASSSKSDDGWRCPACQNVVKEVPRDYYCFCGKVKNPPYNRQDMAHSCGEICGRIEGCPHACTLLCHPGPCPPCQANVIRACGCGKTTKTLQCCLKELIACDAICGKLLNCELHTCAAQCHDGKCASCAEKVEQHCHCSKQERQVACTRDTHDKHSYSCGKPCGRDLLCGKHKCKDCCHAGECRPCKLSPEMVTSCPCGKMPIVAGQRSSCLDAIPVCEGICGKTLRCGKAAHPHHCTSKCHLGNCPPCNKQTAVKCRCGHMDQMIKCRQLSTRADDARCKKRCVKKRSCGKHKCNQECCIDIDHICPLPCTYTLSCGKHKCDQPCHRGNCPPCYRSSFDELFCECGAEVIYPPVPCGTKRPICKRPCSRTHQCEHPPTHNCHSAATCPPCMMFTTKWCFGQHETRKTIPCSQASFSCGLACNKPLTCGRHKCIKPCHEGVCQTSGEVCKQSCLTLRPTCGHKCMAPCHDGTCPETPCKEMVEVQCECGNRKQMRSCHDLAREYSRIATAQLASSMAEMQRGNYMELSEILAPVKTNKTNKTLDCNEECRLLERNRRLAIGLQVRNPDLSQKLLTKYSDFIRSYAKRDPTLVKNIYDALSNLVKLAKESKQKSRSHSFPVMNREKRQLVHELCQMFGVDSVAYDAEPSRNVVATAHKDRSWLPATSIMEVMQRESGQRRVPVPSNNAWGLKR